MGGPYRKHQRQKHQQTLVAVTDSEARELQNAGLDVLLLKDCAKPPHPKASSAGISMPTVYEAAMHTQISASFREAFKYTTMDYDPMRQIERTRHLQKARLGTCITRAEAPGLLFADVGLQEPNGGCKVLPVGTAFYKGTRYFNDSMKALGPDGKEHDMPFIWVGNALTAVNYAQRYHGGVMAYRAARDLRLFVLSRASCLRLYETTPWSDSVQSTSELELDQLTEFDPEAPFDALGPLVKAAFETKFGVGISLSEQVRRVQRYNTRNESLSGPMML